MSAPQLSKEERIVYAELCRTAGAVGEHIEQVTYDTMATEYLGLSRELKSLRRAYDIAKQLKEKGYLKADFGWREITNVRTLIELTKPTARSTARSEESFALVMKGGGVKVLAYVGALKELDKYFRFDWFVGTSGGAIAAALLGAGYTSEELEAILYEKNFRDFLDAGLWRGFRNWRRYKGIFPGDELTNWIDGLLARKLQSASRVRLGQLPYRITLYASRRDNDTLVFDSFDPRDRDKFAAFAVRCSIAIPYVFTPPSIEGMRVLDGGLRNNYPVDALLKDNPDIRFLGLYLGPRTYEGNARKDREGSLIGNLLSLLTESTDWRALEQYREQTIIIDCSPISTLNFKLSKREKDFLINAGRAAALEYLGTHAPTVDARAIHKSEVGAVNNEVEEERKLLKSSRRWWKRISTNA